MTLTVFWKKYGKVVIIGLIFIITALLLIFPPFGRLQCKISSAPGDLSAEYKYSANFAFWIVNDLTIEEVVSSEDKEALEKYKNEVEEHYKIYDDFKSITNDTILDDNSLVTTFHVDYNKISSDEVKKIESSYLKKKITVGTLKKLYKNNGASCRYK